MFTPPGVESPLPANTMGSDFTACQRVDELWFKDGTLVLLAETSLFRVYGGLLAMNSPIFHDMLDFSQPDNAERIDECPVVRLADGARDLTYFLKAVFNYEFFGAIPAKTTFAIVSGVIRLSTKYQVDALRNRALAHLWTAFSFTPNELYIHNRSWEIPPKEWIRIVLFAREMSIDWILPVAFYRVVANSTPTELQNGLDLDGGHMELEPRDKIMCLEQSLDITRSACSEITQFLWQPLKIPNCSSSKGSNPGGLKGFNHGALDCMTSRMEARQKVEQRRREKTFPMDLWVLADWEALKVCSVCMSAMKPAHQRALDTFWESLPQRFGFPGWRALKQMKDAALA
ncbi:hypothetical protein C8R44DRAFT_823124 [Mycena epipterygia]|nr:hypothetical protein C8R44DRAFT_823124 [Mycena epipterygia]